MIQQLFTICRSTFIESIRQPIFLVLTLVAIFLLILNTGLASYTLDDDNKLLVDMSLSTILVIGLFLAAFTATGVISNEVENKTVLTVISKPVSRPIFVAGKFLGITLALALAYWVMSIAMLMTVRHQVIQTAGAPFDTPVIFFGLAALVLAAIVAALGNYFYQWVFTSTMLLWLVVLATAAWALVMLINKQWMFQSPMVDLRPELLVSLLLVFQALLIITAVAIAASTRLGQVMTLVICVLAFFWGMVGEYLVGQIAGRAGAAPIRWIHRLTPNLQIFWPADILTAAAPEKFPFTGSYMMQVSAYCALMVLGILAGAVFLFQTREVG